jgi:transcriptional regulator NrdR family protein
MKCPKCQSDKNRITETIQHEDFTYRRRMCNMCFTLFRTKEEVYKGVLPQKPRRLTKAEPKEYQKHFATDLLKRFWK